MANPKDIFRELAQKIAAVGRAWPEAQRPLPDFKVAVSGTFVPFETDISLPGGGPDPGGG